GSSRIECREFFDFLSGKSLRNCPAGVVRVLNDRIFGDVFCRVLCPQKGNNPRYMVESRHWSITRYHGHTSCAVSMRLLLLLTLLFGYAAPPTLTVNLDSKEVCEIDGSPLPECA